MPTNLDKIRALRDKAAEEAARRSAKFYEFKKDRNILRVLPPWEGADEPFRVFGKHWNLGPEGKTMVFCPRICFDKPCPICDNIDRTYKSKPDDATKEWLKSISASQRYFFNVIDMNDIDAGIQIAEFPKTVYVELLNIMVDGEVGYGDITGLEDGRDILIDKTGKGLSTRYAVRAKHGASPVPFHIEPSDIPNLDMMVRNESYENLKLIWEGKEPLPSEGRAALPPPAATPRIPLVPASGTVIETTKVGGTHVAPPPVPDMTAELEAKAEAAAVAASAAPSVPECIGNFDENNATCLDCAEQDDCELKMLEAKRAARKAKPAPAAAPAKAPAATATPAPAAPGISAEDLMAEMEAAISR